MADRDGLEESVGDIDETNRPNRMRTKADCADIDEPDEGRGVGVRGPNHGELVPQQRAEGRGEVDVGSHRDGAYGGAGEHLFGCE